MPFRASVCPAEGALAISTPPFTKFVQAREDTGAHKRIKRTVRGRAPAGRGKAARRARRRERRSGATSGQEYGPGNSQKRTKNNSATAEARTSMPRKSPSVRMKAKVAPKGFKARADIAPPLNGQLVPMLWSDPDRFFRTRIDHLAWEIVQRAGPPAA